MTIVPFLEGRAFGPQDIQAMSTALEDVQQWRGCPLDQNPLPHQTKVVLWTQTDRL